MQGRLSLNVHVSPVPILQRNWGLWGIVLDPTTNKKKGGRLYYLCLIAVSYRQDLEQLSGAFRRSVNKRAPDITDILRYFYF